MVSDQQHEQRQRPTIWQVIMSILAAAFGVQTQRARVRDFTHGNPAAYIIGGIVFTVTFVLALMLIVRFALRAAGG
ncbi:MAG TPA: DUF2970 domain-containing protein [Gammaproteobacteria bacterium]|nr:DUF2970 domain-containing protein [Gammaproteobacteria bacterium]